jgi:hypothetical protein
MRQQLVRGTPIAMGASFRDCDFTDAVLRGADLKDTDFTGAHLIRTDLSRDNLGGSTELQGADLSAATIQSCRFDGAQYDSKTRFPKGFYPEKHGLQLHERTQPSNLERPFGMSDRS